MKNNTYFHPASFMTFMVVLCSFCLNAQTPYTVVASGLKAPSGMDVDQYNRLWLVQTGSGKNDGSLSILRPDGMTQTVVKNLPSVFNPAVNELTGAWHPLALPNHQMALVQGEGQSAASGSLYVMNLYAFMPGVSEPLELDDSDDESRHHRNPHNMRMKQYKVTEFLKSQNIDDSNPYSVAFDMNRNAYVADAAANAVVKFTPNGRASLLATLPDFKNPTPVGPPFVNQVPTRIISRPGGGFYLSNLSGFPFLEGKSNVYTLSTEGVIKPFKTGLSIVSDMAVDNNTGDLYVLQLGTFSLKIGNWEDNSSKILRIRPDGSSQVVAEGFGVASSMALDKKGNIYVSETFKGRVLKFDRSTVKSSLPFFSENFNKGIPATWSNVDSTGNSVIFTNCDSTCLKAYQDQYSADFYDKGVLVSDGFKSFQTSTFRAGVASLVAIKQTNLNTTLTSPAINCSGKNKVFLAFNAIAWGGINADTLQTNGQATTACMLRVSRDGRNWKDYQIFGFGIRDFENAFYDISEVAANQSEVYIQFRRTGPEKNAIFALDDIRLLETAPLRNVTVIADMSSESVSPKGVHIALENDNWNPSSMSMTDMGNGIYQSTIVVPQSEKVHYKFINGDSESGSETVPMGCGERNAAGVLGRIALGGFSNKTLDLVCFGRCMQCGNLDHKAPLLDCPTDANTLYCENFESMQYGKLVPQVPNWSTYSLAFNFYTDPTTVFDNPEVTGYKNGFTNFDGNNALKIRSNPITQASEDPLLDLGNPTEGTYQIDFKIYVPKNRSGMIMLDDATGNPSFTMNFSTDSLYLLSFPDFATFDLNLIGKTVKYKQDDWNAISLTFNVATNKMTLKLNNVPILHAIDAAQTGYGFMEFWAADFVSGLSAPSEFYIDDIVYRRIPDVQGLKAATKKPLLASISPNPANERLLITPEADTEADWQVRLLNSVGQLVLTQKSVGATPLEMDIQALNAGVYVLEFQSNETRWTKKVVIQH